MNILRLISTFNWAAIAFLAYLVIAETLFPAKGGDAAGRGMGQAIYYLAITALVVLLLLRFLPYNWAKYTAFGLVVLPILFTLISPVVYNWKRSFKSIVEHAKPFFEDPERERFARAIDDGNPGKLKELLQTPPSNLNQDGELLSFAINSANSTSYKPQEKLECVRLLLAAGAKLDSTNTEEVPIYMAVAETGNAALLRLLLENGADPNAMQHDFHYPILFAAIESYQQPEASVRALLDFGADTEATSVRDDEQGPITPLWYAADMGRWGICATLLEKKANPNCRSKDGTTFLQLVEKAAQDFSPDSYTSQEDFDRLKKVLQHKPQ